MSNVLGIHAILGIEFFFEREDDQHLADVSLDLLDASLSPCPQLRTDEIHNGDAAFVQLSRESKIEIRKVDQDSDFRLATIDFAQEFMKFAVDMGQMFYDF